MILISGISSEPPFAMVRRRLEQLGVPAVFFNQRRFDDMELAFDVGSAGVTGLRVNESRYRLEDFTGSTRA